MVDYYSNKAIPFKSLNHGKKKRSAMSGLTNPLDPREAECDLTSHLSFQIHCVEEISRNRGYLFRLKLPLRGRSPLPVSDAILKELNDSNKSSITTLLVTSVTLSTLPI